MRPKERIKRILDKIQKLWEKNPDHRLFQLLYNYTRLGTRPSPSWGSEEGHGLVVDPFFYEDDDIEKELDEALI